MDVGLSSSRTVRLRPESSPRFVLLVSPWPVRPRYEFDWFLCSKAFGRGTDAPHETHRIIPHVPHGAQLRLVHFRTERLVAANPCWPPRRPRGGTTPNPPPHRRTTEARAAP